MYEQYSEERINTSASMERTDQDTNSPVENSDAFADQEAPMVEAPVQETPMGVTVAEVGPVEETILREAPMGETLYYKAQVSETIADESLVSKPVPYQAPMGETITHEAPTSVNAGPLALLNRDVSEQLRTRWNEIQGKFVDEPRAAVQQADALVSEVIEQITHMFASEHSALEGQWKQGNDVSTEDLRKALQRYRSFFNRLVV
jgi:hypothetical protein